MAEIHAAPDQATIRVGVESRHVQLAAVKADHDERMKQVLNAAHAAGVEAKDIHTSELSMGPEYSENRWSAKPSGYQVSQSISIRLRDMSKFEGLMTALLNAGVNRVEGIQFEIADPAKLRSEARLRAIRVAKEKATSMAAELNQTIGQPWEISEAPNFD
jgi:hypothetical protein